MGTLVLFGLIALGVVLALAFLKRISRGRRVEPESDAPAHDCPPGRFAIGIKSYDRKLGDVTLHVFDGVFCMRCGIQLHCVACGRTPQLGALIQDALSMTKALHCCGARDFRPRPGAPRFASPWPDDDGGDPPDPSWN